MLHILLGSLFSPDSSLPWGIFLAIYFGSGLIIGGYCAALASNKGQDQVGHFFGGLFFGIIDLLYLIGLKDKEKEIRDEIVSELMIGDEYTKRLAEIVFYDKSVERRGAAYKILIRLGPRALPSFPILVDILQNANDDRVFNAVRVIYSIGRKAQSALPHLENLLKEAKEDVDDWEMDNVKSLIIKTIKKLERSVENK